MGDIDPHAGHPPSGGVHRFDGCPDADELVRALVERLRTRRGDLAAAVGGQALSVEVSVTPSFGEPYRLGIAGEGYVTTLSPSNPLTLGFSPDVTIRGTARDVLDVLIARDPTQDGIRLSEASVWPRYARVHRIVASELREML